MTDSGSEVRRDADKPGVTNLIDIMTVATGEPPEAIEARYDGGGYGGFKSDVAEAVVTLLAPIQERYSELRGDSAELTRLLALGAEKAREEAAPTLRPCTSAWASSGSEPLHLGRLSARHAPGSSPSTLRPAYEVRRSQTTGWPTASSIRFT